jgi:hypothetical protein
VDCVRFVGDLIVSKSVNNKMLLWKAMDKSDSEGIDTKGHIHLVQASSCCRNPGKPPKATSLTGCMSYSHTSTAHTYAGVGAGRLRGGVVCALLTGQALPGAGMWDAHGAGAPVRPPHLLPPP